MKVRSLNIMSPMGLGLILVHVACSGGGGGGPVGVNTYTLSDLIGLWNTTQQRQSDTCNIGAPPQIIEVWEFAASANDLQYYSGGSGFGVIFTEAGNLSYSVGSDGVNITFQGRLTSRTTMTGTLQAIGGGCSLTYSVSGKKL